MTIFDVQMMTLAFHLLVPLVHYTTIVAIVVTLITGWTQLTRFDYFTHILKHLPLFYSIWSYVVQVVCYSLILAAEIIRLMYPMEKELLLKRNKLLKISNNLLFSLVFPTALVTFFIFWGIFLYDRELIYPEELDPYLPQYLNHALHTFPVIVIFPSVINCKKDVLSKNSAFLILAFYNMSYVTKMAISKVKMLRLAFHVLVPLVHYTTIVVVIVYTIKGWDELLTVEYFVHNTKFSPFFYSLWSFAAQIVCYNLILAAEVISLMYPKDNKLLHLRDKLLKISNNLLFSIVFPTAPMVIFIFWSLYLYDRELIFPKACDIYFPKFMNHALHTFPLFVIFISVIICEKNIPSRKSAFLKLAFFNISYLSLFGLAKYFSGRWPYFAFERLSINTILFITVSIIIWTPIFQVIGYKIYKSCRHKDE